MKASKLRTAYDSEVPAPCANSNGCEKRDGYHDYSLPRAASRATSAQYDKPRTDNFRMDTEGTSQGTAIKNSNETGNSRNRSTIRNYDVPKDTLNDEVLKRYHFLKASVNFF
ncbi:unnamed protein product [Gongylonema pulchrum]|uniref:Uncharacterized protein n=1 Tax=Gongylonema pulchrum TaxID=637853 RepID=A0A183EZD8_9BILA|nr:unnamed protein product [Gongylonema pulchrum]